MLVAKGIVYFIQFRGNFLYKFCVIKEFVINGVTWGVGFDSIRYTNDSVVRGWINLVGNVAIESSSVMKYIV